MRKRALVAVVIAAWLSSGVVEGCAVMASGECVEKSTCVGSEIPVGPVPGDPAAVGGERVEGDTPGAVELVVDGASNGVGRDDGFWDGSASEAAAIGPETGAVTPDVGPEEAPTPENATADSANEAIAQDAPTADLDSAASADSGLADANADGPGPPDSGVDVPGQDAAGDGSTCAASSCSNACVPYFVACCKPAGGCGCSLLFPPGPCL